MSNTATVITTKAGEALIAQMQAENKVLVIDKFIFANVPNRPAFPNRDDVVPVEHVVHESAVHEQGRLTENSVIYSTTLASNVGSFSFNWSGLFCSEHNVLVAINFPPPVDKTVDAPGITGNTLVRSFVLEYKGISETTNITVDPSSWQYDAHKRMSKMDNDTAQAIIDQNGKDWFIDNGFIVTPQSSAYNIKAGAGYVSGHRISLDFDRIIQVSEKPAFIYVDAFREGSPTGEWQTKFTFVVSADEKDDYADAQGVNHFVCKIAQVFEDGSVSDLREKEKNDQYLLSVSNLYSGKNYVLWDNNKCVKKQDALLLYMNTDDKGVQRFYLPNPIKLPFITNGTFSEDLISNYWIEDFTKNNGMNYLYNIKKGDIVKKHHSAAIVNGITYPFLQRVNGTISEIKMYDGYGKITTVQGDTIWLMNPQYSNDDYIDLRSIGIFGSFNDGTFPFSECCYEKLQSIANSAGDFGNPSALKFRRNYVYPISKSLFIPCGVNLITDCSQQKMGATLYKTTNDKSIANGYLPVEGKNKKSNAQDAVLVYATRFGKGYWGSGMNNFGGKGSLVGVNIDSAAISDYGIYGYSINNFAFEDFTISSNFKCGYFSWNNWRQIWKKVTNYAQSCWNFQYDVMFNTTTYMLQCYCHGYRGTAIQANQNRSLVLDNPIFEQGNGQMVVAQNKTYIQINGIHAEFTGQERSLIGSDVRYTSTFVADSNSKISLDGGYIMSYYLINDNPVDDEYSALFSATAVSTINVKAVEIDIDKSESRVWSKRIALVNIDKRSIIALNNVTASNVQEVMKGGGAIIEDGGELIINSGGITKARLLRRLGFPCLDANPDANYSPVNAFVDTNGKIWHRGDREQPFKSFSSAIKLIERCDVSDYPSYITLLSSHMDRIDINGNSIPVTIDLGGFEVGDIYLTNSSNVCFINGKVRTIYAVNSEYEASVNFSGNPSMVLNKGSKGRLKGNISMPDIVNGFNVKLFDGSSLSQYGGIINGQYNVQVYSSIATCSTSPTAIDQNDGGRVFS
ncbi:hypothetical protein C0W54_21875 [Photobacterium kishitanii]|uniref:phage tail-collar fiber domain-containing protein n=1 Tax=Photobacterium kishitanii TaxID=318456 RepID=UPI000D152D6F|nr:phage tail protein [Photobacterium kishitanii]PSW57202.1 hypothetical protein C0W54_21875 [Photobacterium kishitanii]